MAVFLAARVSMATIHCRCGGVTLKFPTEQAVHAFECCCVDCYDKNLWSCRQAGAPPPANFATHGVGRPVDLRYFPNRLVVNDKAKLTFNRLRDGASSVNMVTSCCRTVLCVDHPAYNENVVLTFPDFLPLTPAPNFAPSVRVHAADWPAESRSQLQPMPSVFWDANGKPRAMGHGDGATILAEAEGDAFRTPPKSGPGESFQSLLAGAGNRIAVLGLPEGPNSATLVRQREVAALRRRQDISGALGLMVGMAVMAVGVALFLVCAQALMAESSERWYGFPDDAGPQPVPP